MKKCSVCGKEITEGYVWDGTDCFCSEECLDSIFETPGTADILIEEGERVVWQQFDDTKIIPTEVFEWVKAKTTTKSGKTINKWMSVSSRKEQECVEVIADFKDKDYTFYIPVEDIKQFESDPDSHTARLYNADGTRVMGTWRHGLTGEKKHVEPVCYNLEGKYIIAVASYNYGFIRNNHKYLLKINF